MLKTAVVSTVQTWPVNTFLGRLPVDLCTELMKIGTTEFVDIGDTCDIFDEAVILITNGVMFLEYDAGYGRYQAVGTFCGRGEIIGIENALAVASRYSGTSLRAQIASQVLFVPTAKFLDFTIPARASRSLLADLAYRHHREKVRRMWERRSVLDRMRLFLEEMVQRFGSRIPESEMPRTSSGEADNIEDMRPWVLNINLTQNQIADAIGASRGAADEAFRNLRRRGIIQTGYRMLRVKVRVEMRILTASEMLDVDV